MSDAPWQITKHTALLRLPGLEAALDVAAPRDGLGQLSVGRQSQAGAIFQWSMPPEAPQIDALETEAYVRGNDLIATYSADDDWPFRVQVAWCALTATDRLTALGGVDMIASVQTDLLDSRPELAVATSLQASELLSLTDADAGVFEPVALDPRQPVALAPKNGAGCVLFRFADDGSTAPAYSYAEMVHAGDVGPATLVRDPAGQVRLERRLFSGFLEKGVILRTRLRGLFLERADDEAAALAWHRALLESKLPLTA